MVFANFVLHKYFGSKQERIDLKFTILQVWTAIRGSRLAENNTFSPTRACEMWQYQFRWSSCRSDRTGGAEYQGIDIIVKSALKELYTGLWSYWRAFNHSLSPVNEGSQVVGWTTFFGMVSLLNFRFHCSATRFISSSKIGLKLKWH